ncbi:anti-ECFsigma factor ChrR [Burkholderia sp. A9]|uniref:Anti-ECFsigma factor ChrR n=1 Tax=Burkholderia cepacia GG4 TaxID=1009846 RepID=A0A9W3K559_BURCE|nr:MULTISPECIES: cupin domain-containing protein [Burkholderia]AFQ51137.1 anti-ECFsigma factor ChrR [Burkholderia cepacia GG4]KHK59985.1 anti-ECFsigma factor ChrR [Burkholderia sp. A9]
MLVNADFSRSVIVSPDHYQWVASPQSGVERVMLDRLGGEKARATSIVRYAPGSRFPGHVHPGGEEILVLSGTFSDDDAHYPAGWYLRNPPGSCHQPFSDTGAVIFVKLWQMSPKDELRVRIDTCDPASWWKRDGREICVLHSCDDEQVSLHRLAPGEILLAGPTDSAELLVIAGGVVSAGRSYERGSWMRLPAGEYPELAAGARGATVYLKTGHLSRVAMGA